MSSEVLVDIQDGIQTITINRPEARNAMTLAAAQAIAAALDSSTAATTCESASSPAPAARSAPAWT